LAVGFSVGALIFTSVFVWLLASVLGGSTLLVLALVLTGITGHALAAPLRCQSSAREQFQR